MALSVTKDQQRAQKLSQNAVKDYGRGRIKEARKAAAKLIQQKKQGPYYLFQTAVAAYNARDLESSLKLHNAALNQPEDKNAPKTNILVSRGLVKSELGDLNGALEDFNLVIAISPHDSRAHNNRSITLQKLGRMDDARADLEKALELDPTNSNALLNLLYIYDKTNATENAVDLITKKSPMYTENPDFQLSAGKIKLKTSPVEALTHFRKAAHLKPQDGEVLGLYADAFTHVGKLKNYKGLEYDLLLLLSHDDVKWKDLHLTIKYYLTSLPEFLTLHPELEHAVAEQREANLNFGQVVQFMSNNVLLAAMKRVRLIDPELEKLLETFRRQTLVALTEDIQLETSLKQVLLSILLPFAKYTFMSEYVFAQSEAEAGLKDQLLRHLSQNNQFSIDSALVFSILCSYEAPHRNDVLSECAIRWGTTNIEQFNQLVKTIVTEPLQERNSLSSFPKLTEISDSISLSVREMYEENPYPRWDHFPNQGSTTLPQQLVNALPILEGKLPNIPQNPEILIAGCGSGQQPIATSYAYPDSKITAVDLSLASMAYAKRKTDTFGIKNITYGQADIMELRSLGQQFDAIECGGVLHHMNDPIAGWQVLVDILKDDGFMKIALYSEIGREDIVACRDFIKENQYSTSTTDIRNCRKHIMSLPDDNPVKQIISRGDFYTMSTCRDLIFHIQEHRFTIPELEQAFETLNLEFLGFEITHKAIERSYIKAFPEDKYRTNLQNWYEFEIANPRTFAAMYQFWVRKKK